MLPTGYSKSLIYQMFVRAKDFKATILVISPLVSIRKQGFLELTFPVLFWFRLPSVPISCFSLVLLLSGVIVVGSCLLHRSSESLQFKSSSTLVLHTACSVKLYSSAAFLILRLQDLQTRSEKFSSLISGNPIEPQHSAKISPTLSSLPDGENRFSNDALPPPEV